MSRRFYSRICSVDNRMKCPGILMSIGSARLALSTSPVTRNYASTLKLSKFVNEEFSAPVIGLTFYSLVGSTCPLVCRTCSLVCRIYSPKYRNVPHIPVLNFLMRKIAGPPPPPPPLIIWSMMATDTKSSCVCMRNAVENQKHHSSRGKTLSDIILFVFLSFLQHLGFGEG